MNRRLYFLLPDVEHAWRVVEELEGAGMSTRDMHAMARPGVDLSSLPFANTKQREDRVWLIERLLWDLNLAVFALALIGLLISLYWGFSVWSASSLLVMLVTFVAGDRFAVKVPHAHLDEVRDALSHGEILLMIDAPKGRVAEVAGLVHRHHPEAALGGVGWTIEAFGI
jgi:hypothetical protein